MFEGSHAAVVEFQSLDVALLMALVHSIPDYLFLDRKATMIRSIECIHLRLYLTLSELRHA